MRINILASSSEGNCTHISTDTASILIDAGISAKKAYELGKFDALDGIFITHEHGDHIKGLGPIGRKSQATVYLHELTHNKIESKLNKCLVHVLKQGEEVTIGDLTVSSFSTRHDSIYSCGYIVSDGKKKLGYLTDTGSWTKLMSNALSNCDGYIIEADYDTQMLKDFEDYDDFLKDRISSNWGHLSNDQTMDFMKTLIPSGTTPEFVCFAHLSPRTNSPDRVLETAYEHFSNFDKTLFKIAPLELEL